MIRQNSRALLAGLCAALVGAAVYAAPDPDAKAADAAPGAHETPPVGIWQPIPRPRPTAPVRPLPIYLRDGFASIQVNIDAFGENIPGDAANEPSIAVDPTAPNRLAIGWRQFDTILSNFRQGGYAYSDDGGRTWAFPGVLEEGVFRSDPVLSANSAGIFFYSSLTDNFDLDLFHSMDAGATWPVSYDSFGGDKQWFTIDTTGGAGDGHIYMTWSGASCCGSRRFTRSTDGGITFEEPIAMPEEAWWGQLDVASNGTLYVAGRDINSPSFQLNRSQNAQFADEDVVFEHSTPLNLGGPLGSFDGDSPNPGGLLGQVNIAVDRSDGPTAGNVYVLASIDPPGEDDPLDVVLIRSTDEGVTWSDPIRINDDGPGAWQWFGTLSVAPNGRIDVVFNDTRNSGQVNVSELMYSSSSDGGLTWSPNQVLSIPFDSHIGWPQQNKLGDYYDMISDETGAHLAWAATFNGEQDVYYLRIGDYDCNGNGVPDSDDITADPAEDCNANGIVDSCEIAAGTADDTNGNGVIDDCEACPGDIDGDLDTDLSDLGILLATYELRPDDPFYDERADLDGDGDVDLADLGELLADFGCLP
jgi:hypothetical protein